MAWDADVMSPFVPLEEIPWGVPPAPVAAVTLLDEPSTDDAEGWLYSELVAAEARVQSLTADVNVYKAMVQEAFAVLARTNKLVARQNERLADQDRQLRELFAGVR